MSASDAVIVIITSSPIQRRVLPRLLNVPPRVEIQTVVTPAGALEVSRTRPAVWVLDLLSTRFLLPSVQDLFEARQAPPTLLLGEPWHLPHWLRPGLDSRLVFLPHPLRPAAINAVVTGLLSRPGRVHLPPAKRAWTDPREVEDLVASIEALLGEQDG